MVALVATIVIAPSRLRDDILIQASDTSFVDCPASTLQSSVVFGETTTAVLVVDAPDPDPCYYSVVVTNQNPWSVTVDAVSLPLAGPDAGGMLRAEGVQVENGSGLRQARIPPPDDGCCSASPLVPIGERLVPGGSITIRIEARFVRPQQGGCLTPGAAMGSDAIGDVVVRRFGTTIVDVTGADALVIEQRGTEETACA